LVLLEQKNLQKNNTMNWKDIKNLIKEELNEAEVTAGGSKFNLRMGVNKNPTKLGVKIQFEPLGGMLPIDTKAKLEVALQEKLNEGLSKYKIQISKDTDVPREEVIGFFIPLAQIKSLVIEGLGQGEAESPDAPLAPEPAGDGEEAPIDEIEDFLNEQVINEMRVRDLNDISGIINKDDFYMFINAGNNIIRDLENNEKYSKSEAKKYLSYLTKHNIM
jgi:hypothetical protein